MRGSTRILLGSGASAFVLLVLVGPSLLAGAEEETMGARTLAAASPAELAMIRSGPITVAQYNTVTAWQADCLRKAGAIPSPQERGDGRVGYGASYSGPFTEATDRAISRCHDLGEAVLATYYYDHLSVFSWTTPYPGLGPAVEKLRAGEPSG
jgi:hypothetical protein